MKPGAEPAGRAVTRNACHLCTPLGACLAYRGVRGAVPFLHGSQGCATYIRRYLISHFREPVDIAASNFSETSAVFGGGAVLSRGLANVEKQYRPEVIGLATTCLSETIGEDVPMLLRAVEPGVARVVHVSTASYRGTYVDGFHDAVRALVAAFAAGGDRTARVNVFPGLLSPADLRHLREWFTAFEVDGILLPDYADTLDAPAAGEYERIPQGGTPVDEIAATGRSAASIQLGRTREGLPGPGEFLETAFGVPCRHVGLPIGIRETDVFADALQAVTGRPLSAAFAAERGRLVDSYVDAHKYVFGATAAVFGEPDLVIGLASLLAEVGVRPVVCASGSRCKGFAAALRAAVPSLPDSCEVRDDVDFAHIESAVEAAKPDLLIGSSKGYRMARALGRPLIRAGFPIHDRIGAQRILHIGYRGAQQLFDRIVNTILETRQDESDTGWSYL